VKESFAFAFNMVGIFNEVRRTQDLLEPGFPLNDRATHQVVAIEVQQIEREIDKLRSPRFSITATPYAQLVLKQLKLWPAVFVERDYLTIENRFFCIDLLRYVCKLGVLRRHLDLIARNESRFSLADEADGSKPIPLRFENPIRIRKWLINQSRQHRMNHFRHARLAGG
jgi:hypothetical protein